MSDWHNSGSAHTNGFLACRDCGALHPVVDIVERIAAAGTDVVDGVEEFLLTHGSHDLAWFYRQGTECIADRAPWDPMVTSKFEVTDGQRSYVVIAGRRSIEEPRRYRFVPGSIELTDAEVDLDDGDLRRGLDIEFFPHALRTSKVDRLLSVIHDIVRHVDPHELRIAFDAADEPAVSIAPMPDAIYQELLARCSDIFDPWELERVIEFLRENRDEDGLLALRVRRHCSVLTA